MAGLLRTLGSAPEYCVGHSAGAAILCRMALERCIAPASSSASTGPSCRTAERPRCCIRVARLLAGSSILSRLTAWHAGQPGNAARIIAGTGSTLDGAGIALYSRLAGDAQHVAGVLKMMANWDLASLARDLPLLGTPLALLAAQNDRAVAPHQALEVQRLVPGCTVHPLPGLGHLAHEEEPQRVAREILRFCGMGAC